MSKRKWPAVFGISILGTALLAGLIYFSGVSSSGGFPDLSSYNSERHGAKLLYDALSRIPSLRVSRNYFPLTQWHPTATAIFYLGMKAYDFDAAGISTLREWEKLTQPDNRLIIAIPDEEYSFEIEPAHQKHKQLPVEKRWGVSIVGRENANNKPAIGLVHDSSWHELANTAGVWEKTIGKGSLVIVMPDWGLSNQEIAAGDTAPTLIPALLGGKTNVAFEETHLGIEASGSIMGLARRYRLQGLLFGFLLLVVLFVWNRLVSFPPTPADEVDGNKQLGGADARGIFAGLITRHLSAQSLISACVTEWNRLNPQRQIQNPSAGVNPVEAYSHIQKTLQQRRTKL